MNYFFNSIFSKYKSVFLLFISILIIGTYSYFIIPKESTPNIDFGYITVNVVNSSISASDAEKLIIQPIENELSQVKNIEEITSTARMGSATIGIKLDFGTDIDNSINKIQNAVSKARNKFPQDTQEAIIKESSMASNSPVIDLIITSDVDFNSLNYVAKKLTDEIEKLPEVLSVDSYGDKEEEIEILVSQLDMAAYNINHTELISIFNKNNTMAPSGTISKRNGNINFNIKGTVDELNEIMKMPLKETKEKVILFEDIAEIRRTFLKPNRKSFFNQKDSIILSVKKRNGENIINTINKIKYIVDIYKAELGNNTDISFSNDQSIQIKEMIMDLENNIISSVFLVFLVILATLSIRTSFLVGLAIPSSFFLGILILNMFGITLNMIVLFSLIMSVGMLVDGAIVVTEYAEKEIGEGAQYRDAYKAASKKMFAPIFSSTLTTALAFMPLLYWPSVTGQFMYYLPLTLIIMLICSLIMSIVFIPTIGFIFSKNKKSNKIKIKKDGFIIKNYKRILILSIKNPKKVISIIFVFSILIFGLFIKFNSGTEFFPKVDSEYTTVEIFVDGDLSINEKEIIVSDIESKIEILNKNFKLKTTKILNSNNGLIGIININLINWKERDSSFLINSKIENLLKNTKGVSIKVKSNQGGPSSQYALEIELSHQNREKLIESTEKLIALLNKKEFLKEIDSNMPKGGTEINIVINREKAAKYGTSISEISPYIQLITSGIKISEFNFDDLDEEIDIRVKYNENERNYDSFKNILINTPKGEVPLEYIANYEIREKNQELLRVDQTPTYLITANIKDGYTLNNHIGDISNLIENIKKESGIEWRFKGDQKEQKETMSFLIAAFVSSVFLIYFVLLLQFNSSYQSMVILISIFLSIVGVLLLFLIFKEPFGIVMGGLGIIALTGIVINNNIVLIDAYNEKTVKIRSNNHKIYYSAVERFRPVMLTTITTVLGLMPMALKLNISIMQGYIYYNSPSSQWWFQLAYTVIGGLLFATILTLILTPSLLAIKKPKYKDNFIDLNNND